MNENDKVLIIAEIGINHNGNLDTAKEMIKAAKDAGCDYVKFQKRTIKNVYTQEELDRPRQSPFGTTNREQKEGLEFDENDYDEINKFCKKQEIEWFASPWDCKSVDFLMRYNIPFIKIASACITNRKLLEKVETIARDIILSTGMCTKEEIHDVVGYLGWQVKYILACTSTYPTVEHELNLSFIPTLKQEFSFQKVGFSNHHPGVFFAAASVAFGAKMVEFHLTLDRAMYGSDQAASIEVPGMVKLVKYIRGLEKAIGGGGWELYDSEKKIREKLRK